MSSVEFEDSKLYACFAIQSNIFLDQATSLLRLSKAQLSTDASTIDSPRSIPEVLKSRTTRLNIDSDGTLSVSNDMRKLNDFEVLALGTSNH